MGISSGVGNVGLVPVGVVVPFAGSTSPAGWLLCFGQAVSRTTYAGLFATISTTYGSGDGSTTFTLPDLRGRVVAGEDDMGGTAASRLTAAGSGITGTTLGATGGTQTHTMTSAEMPSHTHTQDAHSHAVQRSNSAATSVGAEGIRTDVITDFTNGTDTIGLAQGGANALLVGVTIGAATTAATTLSNVVDTTSVANIAAVYTAIAANTSFSAANFAVSTGAAGGLVNRTITFTSGTAAGTYLVINDGTTAGFNEAADLVIGLGNAANPVAFSAAAITTFA
jgi:microcystin-dependent protein